MGQEPEDERDRVRRHEGFCPGCGQPFQNGVVQHKPHCPWAKNAYDTPDEPGYGRW